MGGAVTAPYEHQLALDHLHRQLEAAGVPSQLVVDILTGQPDKISVPTEISKKHQLFISGRPASEKIYCDIILPSELMTTPMYDSWGIEEQNKKKISLINAHLSKLEVYESEKSTITAEIARWEKTVHEVKQKQSSLCATVLKCCDSTIVEHLHASVAYQSDDVNISLKHNICKLIAAILDLAEATGTRETPLESLTHMLYRRPDTITPIDKAVSILYATFRRYKTLFTAEEAKNQVDVAVTATKLSDKEKEIVTHFIYHGVTDMNENIYVYLCELINGNPPIAIPCDFTSLMELLTRCRHDLIACKSVSVNVLNRMMTHSSFGTVSKPPPTPKKAKTPTAASTTTTPSAKPPTTAPAMTTTTSVPTDACRNAAHKFAEQPCFRDLHDGVIDQYCPRLSNGNQCRYSHQVKDAKKYLSALGNTNTSVTNDATNPYPPTSSPSKIPYYGSVTMIGGTPASALMPSWYPPHTILLDEGSNVHCANSALMDMTTLHRIPTKYNGTIGGWILTDQAGVMPYTQLTCDYTPRSPFNIISKSLIERDPSWRLVEGILSDTHVKCYELHRSDGHTIRFVPMHGVYIHIANAVKPLQPSYNPPQLAAASVTLPQQFIDNMAHLTLSSTEKHGLLHIYPLLESGLSYSDIEALIRTKHITNVTNADIGNAKLVLGYDRPWLAGNNKLTQIPPAIPRIPHNVQLRDITVTFDMAQMFHRNCLIGIGANICDIATPENASAPITKHHVTAMIQRYHNAGYRVAAYAVDAGSTFCSRLKELLTQTGLRQDLLHGGEHAASAEVTIRILKYKLRALIVRHGRKVPNTANKYTIRYDLITHAFAYVAQHFLMRIRKGNTISASEALTGIMPTYEDFALPFLTPVEITDISKTVQRNNTNLALTNTCLSLEPLGDGRGGYRFYNLRTKKIITRAANQYTKLTRMDEGIYNAYTDYIYDRAGNVEFDIDTLHVDDHPIDDEYIGSTAFTRAVRYNPVVDVLHPTADAQAHTVIPTVADTGVAHTPPAQHAPANTGTVLSPTDNGMSETGVALPTADMPELGVAQTSTTMSATGVDATLATRRPRKRRQHKQLSSQPLTAPPTTDGATGAPTAVEAVPPRTAESTTPAVIASLTPTPSPRSVRFHASPTAHGGRGGRGDRGGRGGRGGRGASTSSSSDISIPNDAAVGNSTEATSTRATPAVAPQPPATSSSTADATGVDSTKVTDTVGTRTSPYPPRTRKIRSYITAATTSTTSDYQNYVSPWDPFTRTSKSKSIKPYANITGKFAIACATIFIAAALSALKQKRRQSSMN